MLGLFRSQWDPLSTRDPTTEWTAGGVVAAAAAPEAAGVRVWQITLGDRRATRAATAVCPGANVD